MNNKYYFIKFYRRNIINCSKIGTLHDYQKIPVKNIEKSVDFT